ncbi:MULTISPECIES: hypothetical protein [unclassified Microcoleus]|uniref:hypothetical protein n=1 Tax=unclassified Microcoleus TaxID=2642155 RepID=UPI002FCEFDA4
MTDSVGDLSPPIHPNTNRSTDMLWGFRRFWLNFCGDRMASPAAPSQRAIARVGNPPMR